MLRVDCNPFANPRLLPSMLLWELCLPMLSCAAVSQGGYVSSSGAAGLVGSCLSAVLQLLLLLLPLLPSFMSPSTAIS